MLELNDLRVAYGRVEVVHGISLSVGRGEIACCVGSNGAGKTSTLKAISGLVRPSGGKVLFDGRDICRLSPHEIVRLGISHVPEGRRIFKDLTVRENLRMGAYSRCIDPSFDAAIDRVYAYFPRLKERQKQPAGTLSGGEQQMLSIGRALISGPKLLLVDEPSFGLAPLIIEEIARILQEINEAEGVTVFLVEQNVNMAFAISDHTWVMENGEIVLSGESQEIAEDPHVRHAYLGLA
jgi:branched-chain amino acid transport system ATP-binding protein